MLFALSICCPPALLIYSNSTKNIESEANQFFGAAPSATLSEITMEENMAANWRGTPVKEMSPEQLESYERHKEAMRKRRAEKRAQAQEEAVVEQRDFAKQSQAAMKKFEMPFEQHFTQEIANKVLMWITCGGDLVEVCKERGVPDYPVVMQWIRPYLPVDAKQVGEARITELEHFRNCYVEARKNKLEKELDDIIKISDSATNKENSAAAKVRVQARVIMLERINVQLFAPTTKSLESNEDKTPAAEQIADALEIVAARRKERMEALGTGEVKEVKVVRSAVIQGDDGA